MAGRRLLGEDGKFIKNKASSVFTVLQANTKVYDQLVTSEVKKVGFNGKNSSDIAAANATKDAEKDRIKTLDAAHYSLSGKAAREQQGLSWYQPLDISTVGGNTRNKGGIDADGDYLNQEVMSFDTPENFTGKMITTNLRSAKNIELFGDSVNALNEINQGAGSESLRLSKDLERTTNAIVAGESASQADNFFIETTKSNIIFEDSLDAIEDERSLIEKAGDMVDDLTKPVADFVSKKIVELHDTTILKPIVSHLVDSVNAADQSLDRFTDNVSDIGKGFVDFGLQYVDAVKSVGTAINTEQDFIRPSEFADMREQAAAEVAKEQKRLQTELNNRTDGYVEYYNNRIKGDAAAQAKKLEDAEKYVAEIMAHKKAHTHRQQVIEQFEVEKEIEAFEEQLKIDLATERSKKIAASKNAYDERVKENISALKREKEDKRQNDLIDGIANKSDEVERLKQAEITRKKQQAILDRQGEERTGGDKEGQVYRKLKAEKTAAAKLKKDLEVADRIGGKQDRDNDRSNDPLFLLAGDPYAFSNLSYPYNVTNSNENGHYILFYVNVQNKTKYLYNTPQVGVTVGDYVEKPGYFPGDDTNIAPSARGSNKFVNSGEASREGGADAGPISYQSQTIKNGGKGNILRNNMKFLQKSRKAPYAGINSRYPTTTRITDSVALYLPTGIGNTTTASYGDSQTGVAGYLALSGVDILQDVKDLDFAGATDKLFGVGGTLITEAIKKIGIGAIQGLTDTEGLTQSFDKIFGQTLNPYIEVTYTSFGMRTFDYTFKFAPESARESDEVKAIIQLFRFHMAPEMKGDAHRYLTLPSTFDIHYMFQSGMGDEAVAKENSFYNKIATCVLTSVDVNYTPNEGVKSFADGAPTQLSMALSFQETEMLTKQKINDGF